MRDRLAWFERRASGLALLLVVALAILLVGLHVRAYPIISPIDELQHIDYLDKASRGEIVARGDRVGELAMRAEACRGIDAPIGLPACDAEVLRPSEFQEAGFNTAYIHPPGYYATSGVLARIGEALPVIDDLVTAGRLTGGLWLALACAVLWVAMGELGASRAARAALVVLVLASPTVLHSSATINPDATALLVGSGMLIAVLRWERGRWPAAAPCAVAAIAILIKSTHVAAVGAAILYVAARHLSSWWESRQPTEGGESQATAGSGVDLRTAYSDRSSSLVVVRFVGSLVGAVLIASVAWVAVQGSIAKLPNEAIPMVQRLEVDTLEPLDVVGELGATVSPLQAPYVPGLLRSSSVLTAAETVNAAFLAAVVIGAVYGAVKSRHRSLAVAALVAMAAAGPLFVFVNFAFVGTFVEIPPRYGLSILPFGLAAAAVALERRPLLIATGLYAAWCLGIVVEPLLTA